MNREQLDELSAVIDNEAGHQVMIRISRRIGQDEELRKTLVRYQMIGDCLRGEEIDPSAEERLLAISRRLDREPTLLAPTSTDRSRSRWFQPLAGAAIAASVAAAAVVLAPRFINEQPGGKVMDGRGQYRVVAEPVGDTMPEPALMVQDAMHWKTVDGFYQERLDRYLEQHSRYATQNGLQRMIPYATLVSYGGIPQAQGE